jgi:hypothetical protein
MTQLVRLIVQTTAADNHWLAQAMPPPFFSTGSSTRLTIFGYFHQGFFCIFYYI